MNFLAEYGGGSGRKLQFFQVYVDIFTMKIQPAKSKTVKSNGG